MMNRNSTVKVSEFREGFTWRSLLAILFGAVVLSPTVHFLLLVAGVSLAGAAIYITVLLFDEIARFYGRPLTKQEIFVMFSLVGSAALWFPFLDFIFRKYYRSSSLAWAFVDPFSKKPIAEVIPSWWAPPPTSKVYKMTTLMHPDWLLPIIVYFTFFIFTVIGEVALAFIFAQLYIEIEDLPYPLAYPTAEVCITLAEREPNRVRVFLLGAMINMFYATFLYGIPMASTHVLGIPLKSPIPWADLTIYIERFLPGACFGIATDLLVLASGFLIPWEVSLTLFISSISVWIIGNNLALKFPELFPMWIDPKTGWAPGMSLMLIYQRAFMWVWVNPIVGVTIAMTLYQIGRRGKDLIRTFKILRKLPSTAKIEGYLPLPILLTLYTVASIGSLIVFHILVPEFPMWIALMLSLFWSFFYGLVDARSIALTGYRLNVPYLWQFSILLSGYPKIDAFYISPYIGGFTSAAWSQTIKVAKLTETKITSFFKAYAFFAPITAIMSFIYIHLFLMLAPIPSSVYAWTAITWPVNVLNHILWVSRQLTIFRPMLIIWSGAIFVVLGIIIEVLKLPLSLIGIVTGMSTLPTHSIMIMIGALINRYILVRKLGEKWNKYKATFVGGMAAGEGVVIGFVATLAMIAKSMWVLPY